MSCRETVWSCKKKKHEFRGSLGSPKPQSQRCQELTLGKAMKRTTVTRCEARALLMLLHLTFSYSVMYLQSPYTRDQEIKGRELPEFKCRLDHSLPCITLGKLLNLLKPRFTIYKFIELL